jgi:hypothetical protein
MAADFVWSESSGIGEDITDDIANINFGSVDAPNIVPATNPVTRGQNSFAKYIRGKFTGTWTSISNLVFWKSSGDYVADEIIKAVSNIAYVTPSQADTGDDPIPVTKGTALSVNSAEGEPIIEYGATGVSGYTAYIRLQAQSTVNTPNGAANSKVLTISYDET